LHSTKIMRRLGCVWSLAHLVYVRASPIRHYQQYSPAFVQLLSEFRGLAKFCEFLPIGHNANIVGVRACKGIQVNTSGWKLVEI
jgi:hypothetical protein